MQAELYEIHPCPQGRIAIAPRPRGDTWLMPELASFKLRGVTDVVSLLPAEEDLLLGLRSEGEFCAMLKMGFHRHPITDHGLPQQPAFDEFLSPLVQLLQQNHFLVIHCRAGIGRSAVTSAALLCRLGVPPDEAVARVSQARGWNVPETEEQLEFIQSLGK